MKRIMDDPVAFYARRMFHHRQRIVELMAEIERHRKKLRNLTVYIERIERKYGQKVA